MYKIQTLDVDFGWINSTRAGNDDDLARAVTVLNHYDEDWPSEKHRLVWVNDSGVVTVIAQSEIDKLLLRNMYPYA